MAAFDPKQPVANFTMKSNWRETAELIGIAAIVASLVFVGLELRQSQTIALVQSARDSLAVNVEHLDSINANIDVWSKGNAGEDLSESDTLVYQNLFRAHAGRAWSNWYSSRELGQFADIAVADFAGFLYENPGALREWRRFREQTDRRRRTIVPDYEEPFALAVQSALTEFADADQ